jgi:predicted permease
MVSLLQDVQYSVRTLRKSPLFASVAVFSLALGSGANAAIFTLIHQLILQPLPVKHPEQLVLLTSRGHHYGSNTGSNALSYLMYTDVRDKNAVFSGIFCRHGRTLSVTVDGRTELVSGEDVSGNYFPVLGIKAALGRVFTASDDLVQGGHPVAVLSYGYWKTRFNADRDIIGRKLVVNGYPMTVIGVSQEGFNGLEVGYAPQIRIPMTMHDITPPDPFPELNNRRRRFVQVYARLKPGMTLEHAKAGLQPLFHQTLQMEVVMPAFSRATAYTKQQFLAMWMDVLPASKGRSELRRHFSTALLALMAIVALVLLIACSNVANLMIARATARQKEIALRLALGASRSRLIGQLLVESALLSAIGGAAGLGLAALMVKALISFLPSGNDPISLSSSPDGSVLAFTAAISIATGLIFGLVPALQSTRPQLAKTLKDQTGSVVGGTSVLMRKTLVIAQVGLSLLLLIGSGLFIQSLKNLKVLRPGFETHNVVTFGVEPTLSGYKSDWALDYYRRLTERMKAIPGVQNMTLAVIPLLADNEWDNGMTVEGYSAKQGESVDPHMQFCSDDFFDTLKIPVLVGRRFDARDDRNAPKVAIVNEKFARRYSGGANPVGHHIGMGTNPGTKTNIEVIGVAGDTKYESMREEIPDEVYIPYRQSEYVGGMVAYVRTAGDPANFFAPVRQVVRETDASVPMYDMRSFDQQMDNSLVTERMLASLSSVFGALATLLAAIGLYGVMAFMVQRRTREIGIRMALGARGGSVVWLVMREVLVLCAAGLAIGLPAAWAITRLVETQLFGIKAADPLTMALAVLGISSVAVLSGYIPARKATNIDPMRALHFE